MKRRTLIVDYQEDRALRSAYFVEKRNKHLVLRDYEGNEFYVRKSNIVCVKVKKEKIQ